MHCTGGLTRNRWFLRISLICLAGILTCSASVIRAEEPSAPVNGGEFTQVMDRWMSLTFLDERSQFRQVCQDLARTQNLAVVIDRRFDPHRPIELPPPVSGSTRHVLQQIAESQQADLKILGDTACLLPLEKAETLKTLIALRTAELSAAAGTSTSSSRTSSDTSSSANPLKWTPNQLRKLLAPQRRDWLHLARPRELVVDVARKCDLRVLNPDEIPHDLWFEGTVARAHTVEFLSLILFQFDLTFAWEPDGIIRIVPIPNQVEIVREHTLTAAQLEEWQKPLQTRFPDSRWAAAKTTPRAVRAAGSQVWEIAGPVELHEELEALRSNRTTRPADPRVPWKERTFTMRVQRKPLGEVLRYLQQAGIPVQFDLEQFKKAGIDPEQFISFEVTNADAEGLFRAICQPISVPFQVTDEEIRVGENSTP